MARSELEVPAFASDESPTPSIAIRLARVPEVDLATLGPRRLRALRRLGRAPARRWGALLVALAVTAVLAVVAFG